jgi:hypothetical protein
MNSEKPESDDYDDDADEVADNDPGLDHLLRSFDAQKRRGAPKVEPAWRRLEKRLEQKRTAELLSDFEDYDIGDDEARPAPKPRHPRR